MNRPLRPAAPPAEPAPSGEPPAPTRVFRIPRPRRPWLSRQPAEQPPAAADTAPPTGTTRAPDTAPAADSTPATGSAGPAGTASAGTTAADATAADATQAGTTQAGGTSEAPTGPPDAAAQQVNAAEPTVGKITTGKSEAGQTGGAPGAAGQAATGTPGAGKAGAATGTAGAADGTADPAAGAADGTAGPTAGAGDGTAGPTAGAGDGPTAAATGSPEAGTADTATGRGNGSGSPAAGTGTGDTKASISDTKTDGTKVETDGAAAGADGTKTGTGDTKTDGTKIGVDGTKASTTGGAAAGAAGGSGGRRRRVPFAHALRTPPRRAAARAAQATREWSRRPSGRLTLPGVFLLALVAATATAGALLVPATAGDTRRVAEATADPSSGVVPGLGTGVPLPPGATAVPALPGGTPLPGLSGSPLPGVTPGPGGVLPTGPAVGPVVGRPADALAAWAQTTGAKVGISPVAMQAYGYAELVLAETNRSCGLSWTTLAAIGFVESRHGQANGATLKPNGRAEDPLIFGLPLDGQGGRMLIRDSDQGRLDNDTTYDRAVGPMQFIPTTWEEIGADADNDGVKDPHNINDAALAAGRYLCKGSRNLTIPGDWWEAILSYNDVRRYALDVYNTANRYGQASRT